MSRVLCETWDSTAHPSEDLGSATAGKGTTSVAPQARKRGNRRADCRKMTHAQPWKSGASAPRKAPKEATGLQPRWTPFARTLVRQTNKTLVIPNRAEGPVRNLLSAEATTSPGCPMSRVLRETWDFTTPPL